MMNTNTLVAVITLLGFIFMAVGGYYKTYLDRKSKIARLEAKKKVALEAIIDLDNRFTELNYVQDFVFDIHFPLLIFSFKRNLRSLLDFSVMMGFYQQDLTKVLIKRMECNIDRYEKQQPLDTDLIKNDIHELSELVSNFRSRLDSDISFYNELIRGLRK